eukprot:1845936-Heterocapsa_arctica.AAC.1
MNEQGQRGELHTQCEQREKEQYHDKNWKYMKNTQNYQSDKEKVHRGMTAEDIDFKIEKSERIQQSLS